MKEQEHRVGGYLVSTDKALLELETIHRYLSGQSYWARGRSLETVRRSIENSLCFGVYGPEKRQVGFARVVTDHATFAWMCDVFVLEAHRGRGLGKALVEKIIGHPDLQGLKRFLLATRDAHGFYRQYGGFVELAAPDMWMERKSPPGPNRGGSSTVALPCEPTPKPLP
jgi:GNAT superfamily N-acetyltransferase